MTKEELFKSMLIDENEGSRFPPPATKWMDIEYIEYKEGEYLLHKVPIREQYYNPGNTVFGGYFSMWFDAAFGPFSFIETQKFCSSLDLNVCFLKPLKMEDGYCYFKANLISASKSFLIMEGKAYKEDKTLVATATSRMIIMRG